MEKVALKPSVKLQPHQEDALKKLDQTDAILLYHGLGSGKTLSSIAATEGDDVTVVTPASLRKNYDKEVNKFVAIPKDKKKYNVISYEGALAGKEGYGDSLVVDEIHRIANSSSGRSQKVMDMAKDYKKRVALSGTPIVNHPSDIAPIIRFLDPDNKDVPLNRSDFEKKFVGYEHEPVGLLKRLIGVKPGAKQVPINQELFREAVKGRVHYHDTDKTHYPDVVEDIVEVPMSREQEDVYKTIVRKANPAIAYKVRKNMPLSKSEMANMNVFMTAARQAATSTSRFGEESTTPKIEAMTRDFMNAVNNDKKFKGVIYSNYIGSGLDALESELKRNGVRTGTFTGKMNDKEKAKAVEDYNNGKTQALLISSAGAEGLDLKGTGMVQVAEPHWNKAKIDQVVGRAARYKSHSHLPKEKRIVNVKKYHSTVKKGTSADQYLYGLSLDKEKLNNAFLDILKEEGLR